MLPRLLVLTLALAGACASAPPPVATPQAPTNPSASVPKGLRIQLTTIHVDDQEKALKFYTDVLGFAKKDDVSNEGFRWLTVTAAGDPDGVQLQLALATGAEVTALQRARFQQKEAAAMFVTSDIKADYDRIVAKGGEASMPPTEVYPGSTITTINDTCGNWIQITQFDR